MIFAASGRRPASVVPSPCGGAGQKTALLAVIPPLAALLLLTSPLRAAADWEWTAGQGWTMGAGAPQPNSQAQMQYAYDLEAAGNYMDASKQYFLLLKHWPESVDAGIALQRLAKCLFQMENYYASYKAINQVILSYPQSGNYDEIIAIELKIGQRLLEHKQTTIFGDPEELGRQSALRAVEIFTSVVRAREFGPSAPDAYLGMGDAYFRLADYSRARDAYQTALDNFPKQPEITERARYGIMKIYAMLGRGDAAAVAEQAQVARAAIEEHISRQPGIDPDGYDPLRQMDAAARELDQQEAAKLLRQAEVYGRIGSNEATRGSLFLYADIVRRFPDTPQADIARGKLGTTKVPPPESQASKFVKGLNPMNWNFFGRDKEPDFIVASNPPAAENAGAEAGAGPPGQVAAPQTAPGMAAAYPPGAPDLAGGSAIPPIAAVPAGTPYPGGAPAGTVSNYNAPYVPGPAGAMPPPPPSLQTMVQPAPPGLTGAVSASASPVYAPSPAPVTSAYPQSPVAMPAGQTAPPPIYAAAPPPPGEAAVSSYAAAAPAMSPPIAPAPTTRDIERMGMAPPSGGAASPYSIDPDSIDLAISIPGATPPEVLVSR